MKAAEISRKKAMNRTSIVKARRSGTAEAAEEAAEIAPAAETGVAIAAGAEVVVAAAGAVVDAAGAEVGVRAGMVDTAVAAEAGTRPLATDFRGF